MAASGRGPRNSPSARACRRPSTDNRIRGKRPYRTRLGLWTSPCLASQTVVVIPSMDDNLDHRVEDADDEAAGQDRGGDAVLLEDFVQHAVPLLEDLEDNGDDDDRHHA